MRLYKFIISDFRLRVLSYSFLWIAYLNFMMSRSIAGIDWLPYQEERVRNAVMHILNNSDFVKYGVTSWYQLTPGNNNLLYAVQAHEYLHYVALMKIGGEELFSKIAPHIDKIIVFGLSIVVAETCINIFNSKIKIPTNLLGLSSFLVFSTLPYTYRMLLGNWQDVYCLSFLLSSYLLFSKGFKITGILLMIYAFLWQYHWSILFGLFYGFIYLYLTIIKYKTNLLQLFPPGFRDLSSARTFTLAFWISPFISGVQSFLLSLNGFSLANSNILYRVGIDSPANIHHGGWLSALQFLGGNRISLCLQPDEYFASILANHQMYNIFTFNCFLSILSMVTISIIAIISYILIAKIDLNSRWILIPLAITYLSFVMFFQQALAAHLQGHSVYFAPIFTIGIIGLSTLIPLLNRKHPVSYMLFVILISTVTINNIRVSFLTGISG